MQFDNKMKANCPGSRQRNNFGGLFPGGGGRMGVWVASLRMQIFDGARPQRVPIVVHFAVGGNEERNVHNGTRKLPPEFAANEPVCGTRMWRREGGN